MAMNRVLTDFKYDERYRRFNDDGTVSIEWDMWGCCVGLQFDICEFMFHKGMDYVKHDYRPSPFEAPGDVVCLDLDRFTEYSNDELDEALYILDRYTELLKRHGKDY